MSYSNFSFPKISLFLSHLALLISAGSMVSPVFAMQNAEDTTSSSRVTRPIVPSDDGEPEEVIEAKKKIILEYKTDFFTSDMDETESSCLMEEALKLTDNQIKAVGDNASLLFTPNMDWCNRCLFFLEVSKVSAKDIRLRAPVVNKNAKYLFMPEWSGLDHTKVLIHAMRLDPKELSSRAQAIGDYIHLNKVNAKMVKSALHLDEKEIPDRLWIIKQNQKFLFTNNTNEFDAVRIMCFFLDATQEQLGTIVPNLPTRLKPSMSAKERYDAIQAEFSGL